MAMIALQPSKRWRGDESVFRWVEAPPFFLNPRGILVHRVRHVNTYHRDGRDSHHGITYLCGNGCTFQVGGEDDRFFDDPPRDRLLCAFCEARAARLELPSARRLTGRHVHIGVLRAHRVCCQKERDEKNT